MATAIGSFERVAGEVAERTAALLATTVYIVDRRGVILASSAPGMLGLRFDATLDDGRDGEREYVRLPLHFDARDSEVVIVRPDGGDAVPVRVTQALVDMLVNQSAVLARLPNGYDLKNKIIHDLLRGDITNEADIVREGQLLGMDFSRPRAVVLIDASAFILAPPADGEPEPSEAQIRARAQRVIASIVGYFDLPDDTICSYFGNGEVAILKASSTRDLAAWTEESEGAAFTGPSWANLGALKRAARGLLSRLRSDSRADITIGLGRYHPGVRGLSRSYLDARTALSLGKRLTGTNTVHCLDSMGIAAFAGVADERTKVELARHLLGPLDGEPELHETLAAFFDTSCCPSKSAKRLRVHRNTLAYRLDKIATLTGLDPRCFDAAVQIRLALLLRDLHHRGHDCAFAQHEGHTNPT